MCHPACPGGVGQGGAKRRRISPCGSTFSQFQRDSSLPAVAQNDIPTSEVVVLKRGLRQSKIEQALDRYARGGISFGAAAYQAGVSRSELARYAHARGMEPPFSAETLAEELG